MVNTKQLLTVVVFSFDKSYPDVCYARANEQLFATSAGCGETNHCGYLDSAEHTRADCALSIRASGQCYVQGSTRPSYSEQPQSANIFRTIQVISALTDFSLQIVVDPAILFPLPCIYTNGVFREIVLPFTCLVSGNDCRDFECARYRKPGYPASL